MMTIDDLRRSWQNINLKTDSCAAYENGKLAGYAELLDGDSPFIYLADRNNAELGSQLLTVLEKNAAYRNTSKLFTRISERNQTLLQLFASNGYTSSLSFIIMELSMIESPMASQWTEGISVRTFIPDQDEQVTYRADEDSSEDKGYHQPLEFDGWVKRMGMENERFDPGLWFLACDGSEIAGVALNFHDRKTNTGWVDHLGVRRAWRKKGIGRALLLHSFGEFYKRGVKTIKLSVDSKSLTNAPKLYQSVGMKTVQQYHIYKKELR